MKINDMGICAYPGCNKIFVIAAKNKKFCSRECQIKHADDVKKIRKELARKEKKDPAKSVRAMAYAAHQAGMSYGEFVAKGGEAKPLPEKEPRKPVERKQDQYDWKRKPVFCIYKDGTKQVWPSVTHAANANGVSVATMAYRVKAGAVINGTTWGYAKGETNEAT